MAWSFWKGWRPGGKKNFSLPDGLRIYAVGDIHGRRDLLDRLLAAVEADAASWTGRKEIVFLGDYVDRGPDAKGVIDRLLALGLPGFRAIYLRGNHDQTLLDFLSDAAVYRTWRAFGGAETLVSYGVIPPRFDRLEACEDLRGEFAAKLPPAHLSFFNNLDRSYSVGGYFFVHAGIRPGVALDRQVPEDLMWIRDEFLFSDLLPEKIVVHGHTPSDRPVRLARRIGIDTGAYATGRLTAAVLEKDGCRFLATGAEG